MKTIFGAFLALCICTAQALAVSNGTPIAYLTDVEGQPRKLADFLSHNPNVYLDASGKIQLKDGVLFVYGGDATDSGPSNIAVTETLIDLKHRYPDRVVIIAGNRDVGKLEIPWIIYSDESPMIELLKKAKLPDTPVNRLKAYLPDMGADSLFEDRRGELAQLRHVSTSEITDQDVLDDYLNDIKPGVGRTWKLLELSQLMFRKENTLIVHGAVLDENFGIVPDRPGKKFSNVDEWQTELNRFFKEQLDLVKTTGVAKLLDDYNSPVPGTYANRSSVLIGRYTDRTGNSRMPSNQLLVDLKKNGIDRIVVGHTPQGDGPTVMRDHGFEIIIGDNTDAPHGSQILIQGDEIQIDSEATVGTPPHSEKYSNRWNIHDETPLGHRLASTDHLIKARLNNGDWITFQVSPPPTFQVTQGTITNAELRSIGVRSESLRKCGSAFSN